MGGCLLEPWVNTLFPPLPIKYNGSSEWKEFGRVNCPSLIYRGPAWETNKGSVCKQLSALLERKAEVEMFFFPYSF